MKLSVILSLLFAVLIAVFALMNGAPVSVNLGFASFVTSQAVVILVSTAIGAVIIYLFDLIATGYLCIRHLRAPQPPAAA